MSDPIISEVTTGSEPVDRLTGFCAVMTDALDDAIEAEHEENPAEEHSDVKGIIFLNDAEKGGIQMFGYEDTGAGMADLLVHMKAIFASMGKGFGVMNDKGEMMMPIGPIGQK